MEYFGESKKLTKALNDERLRTKTFGKTVAKRIRERLDEFAVADHLSDISRLPPVRMHLLKGDRANLFTVDVSANYRMIFEGYDKNDQLSTQPDKIITIQIVEVVDYH